MFIKVKCEECNKVSVASFLRVLCADCREKSKEVIIDTFASFIRVMSE